MQGVDLLSLPVCNFERLSLVRIRQTEHAGLYPRPERAFLWFTLRSLGHRGLRNATAGSTRGVLADTLGNAVLMGDMAWVKRLVASSPDVTTALFSALAWAGTFDSWKLAATLLDDDRIRRDPRISTLLNRAVARGSVELVRMLFEKGLCPDNNDDAMMLAVYGGNKEMVELLLDMGQYTRKSYFAAAMRAEARSYTAIAAMLQERAEDEKKIGDWSWQRATGAIVSQHTTIQ